MISQNERKKDSLFFSFGSLCGVYAFAQRILSTVITTEAQYSILFLLFLSSFFFVLFVENIYSVVYCSLTQNVVAYEIRNVWYENVCILLKRMLFNLVFPSTDMLKHFMHCVCSCVLYSISMVYTHTHIHTCEHGIVLVCYFVCVRCCVCTVWHAIKSVFVLFCMCACSQ